MSGGRLSGVGEGGCVDAMRFRTKIGSGLSMWETLVSPEEFMRLQADPQAKRKIRSAVFLPPRLGEPGFGSFRVTWWTLPQAQGVGTRRPSLRSTPRWRQPILAACASSLNMLASRE